MTELLTTIHDGQPYVDEPVYLLPKKQPFLQREIGRIFGNPQPVDILVGYDRIKLVWMRRDKLGKLVRR